MQTFQQQEPELLTREHPTSPTHPRMTAAQRAAQFAPFAALSGYGALICETARRTEPGFTPSEHAVEELDYRFRLLQAHADEQPPVELAFFVPDRRKAGGSWHTARGVLLRVDPAAQLLVLADGTTVPMAAIRRVDSPVLDRADSVCETDGKNWTNPE